MNYTYDALQRLTHAETVSAAWGQTYAFDGFGNLTAKTVTKGSGSNWAQAYDPATNHMTGNPLITYDPNGNIIDENLQQTYDVENRVTTENIDIGSTSHPTWYYDASGKRVVEIETLANGNKQWTLYAYDIFGKVYATLSGDSYSIGVPTRNAYFGDRLIQSNGAWVVTDRLGSVRANSNGETFSYLPYGEERTPTANSRIKFGTYFRDSTTYNQDYADQRYYNPWFGRFNSPDPGGKAVDSTNPISWNMYAYTNLDPVNKNDPTGLDPTGTLMFCVYTWMDPLSCNFYLNNIGQPGSSSPGACAAAASLQPGDPLFQQCFGPPPPTQPTCPTVPLAPPGASLNANTTAAEQVHATQMSMVRAGDYNYGQALAAELGWLIADVNTGGKMDYKQQGDQYRAFGNFNFGAVAAALGLDLDAALQGAGVASITNSLVHGRKPKWGLNPLKPSFGDNPQEQQEITNGYAYYKLQHTIGCVGP